MINVDLDVSFRELVEQTDVLSDSVDSNVLQPQILLSQELDVTNSKLILLKAEMLSYSVLYGEKCGAEKFVNEIVALINLNNQIQKNVLILSAETITSHIKSINLAIESI